MRALAANIASVTVTLSRLAATIAPRGTVARVRGAGRMVAAVTRSSAAAAAAATSGTFLATTRHGDWSFLSFFFNELQG